jgi:hypothetical protein
LRIICGRKVTEYLDLTNQELQLALEKVTKANIMFDDDAFTKFIHKKAAHVIGEGCIIGSAAIVFEFIAADGRVGFSVLRPPGHNVEDTLDLLVHATETIVMDYHENRHKFDYEDGLDDDLPEQDY